MGRVLMQMEIYEWGKGGGGGQIPSHTMYRILPKMTPLPSDFYIVFFFLLSSFPCYEDHGVVCYMVSERCRQY